MKTISIGILFALAIMDVVYGIVSSQEKALSFPALLLCALAVFLLMSDTVTKLVLSPIKGVTIENKIASLKEDAERLSVISKKSDSKALKAILHGQTNLQYSVWGELVTYRMVMRLIIRRLYEQSHGGTILQKTPSLSGMLLGLRESGVLSDSMYAEMERIRDATFVAEWGVGDLPPDADIQWVLERGESSLSRLQSLIEA
jgi:hypothetical protein